MKYGVLIFLLSSSAFMSHALAVPESTVSHRPGDFIKSIEGDPSAGKKVYEEFCASCHAVDPSIAVGAPRFRVTQEWKPFMHQDFNLMMRWVDEGIGAMPPRGGCFECSDQNLKDAVVYMLPQK